jgi:hypothetical protein
MKACNGTSRCPIAQLRQFVLCPVFLSKKCLKSRHSGSGIGNAYTSPERLLFSGVLIMDTLLPVAAIGYSLLYLLLGGGFGGAVLIFIIAKMLGK